MILCANTDCTVFVFRLYCFPFCHLYFCGYMCELITAGNRATLGVFRLLPLSRVWRQWNRNYDDVGSVLALPWTGGIYDLVTLVQRGGQRGGQPKNVLESQKNKTITTNEKTKDSPSYFNSHIIEGSQHRRRIKTGKNQRSSLMYGGIIYSIPCHASCFALDDLRNRINCTRMI